MFYLQSVASLSGLSLGVRHVIMLACLCVRLHETRVSRGCSQTCHFKLVHGLKRACAHVCSYGCLQTWGLNNILPIQLCFHMKLNYMYLKYRNSDFPHVRSLARSLTCTPVHKSNFLHISHVISVVLDVCVYVKMCAIVIILLWMFCDTPCFRVPVYERFIDVSAEESLGKMYHGFTIVKVYLPWFLPFITNNVQNVHLSGKSLENKLETW